MKIDVVFFPCINLLNLGIFLFANRHNMDSEIRRIDLKDWIETGGGAVGKTYENREDPDLLLKMSNGEASLDKWKLELRNSKALIKLGISTPEPGFIAFDGSNYGLAYKKIRNKISYARMVGQTSNDGEIDSLAESFAKVAMQIHSTNGQGSGLRYIKDVVEEEIRINPFHDDFFKSKAMKILRSLPDGDSVIHGDLHFGNLINADGKDYLIDLGNAAYGYYMFDLAMPLFATAKTDFGPEEYHIHLFHCNFRQSDRFHQKYFDCHLGKHIELDDLRTKLAPYMCMRLFSMENELGKSFECPLTKRLSEYILAF